MNIVLDIFGEKESSNIGSNIKQTQTDFTYLDIISFNHPCVCRIDLSVIDVNNEVKLTMWKLAGHPSNSLNITNMTPRNRIPLSPIRFLLLGIP